MTTNKPTIENVAYGDTSAVFSEDERMAILWQYRHHLALGSFMTGLLAIMDDADASNVEKIGKGYPALAEGVTRWRNESGYADSIRDRLST